MRRIRGRTQKVKKVEGKGATAQPGRVETAESLGLEKESLNLRIQSIDEKIAKLSTVTDDATDDGAEDALDEFMVGNRAEKDKQVLCMRVCVGSLLAHSI